MATNAATPASGGTILGMTPMTLASTTLFTILVGAAAYKFYNPTFEAPIVGIDLFKGRYTGKLVQHPKKNISAAECHKQAVVRKDKYKGFVHLNEKYSDPQYRNTCFFQTEVGDPIPLDTVVDKNMADSVVSGCINVGEKLADGCSGGAAEETPGEQPESAGEQPATPETPPEEKEPVTEGFRTRKAAAEPIAANMIESLPMEVDFGPKVFISKNSTDLPDGCKTNSVDGKYAMFKRNHKKEMRLREEPLSRLNHA